MHRFPLRVRRMRRSRFKLTAAASNLELSDFKICKVSGQGSNVGFGQLFLSIRTKKRELGGRA